MVKNDFSRPSDVSVVELLLASWLARRDAGEQLELEELCRANPAHADELRALASNLQNFEAAVATPHAPPGDAGSSAFLRSGNDHERYETIEGIGRGGMAEVLAVHDRVLPRTLAMKVALERVDASHRTAAASRAVRRFIHEAGVLADLDHPGIVPVHDLGVRADGRPYFTMRRIRGRDLKLIFRLVRDGRESWTTTRALNVLLRVCDTMAFAHSRGVIHRDLKPANIMVGDFGEVYVIDWGLARRATHARDSELARGATELSTERPSDDATQSEPASMGTGFGDVLGTPAYMPPDQARGEVEGLDERTDVYAVGAILYELLAGFPPYGEDGDRTPAHALLARVVEGAPASLDSLPMPPPGELVAIASKAMSRDRSVRYSDMRSLGLDLQAFLERRVVRAYEVGAWAEARKWVARNKPFAASLMGVVVLIVAGSAAITVVQAAHREELRLTADYSVPDYLVAEDDRLWPGTPAQIPDLRSWLRIAEDLSSRRELHRARLRESSWGAASSEGIDKKKEARLVAFLDDLQAPESGRIALVKGRLEFASTIAARSTMAPDAALQWKNAIEAISHLGQYRGLQLTPQLGLLPIGADHASGLWEFAHLQTGEPAQRGADGRLVLTENTGLVFVLLPRGRFTVGAQAADPNGPNYDPAADADESPLQEVEFEPFFISKYEMTQGQWQRTTGRNPSAYRPNCGVRGYQGDLRHPVEQVSWSDCATLMQRLGLALPSEQQWERAARAGTNTPWWTGAERETLRGNVNMADQTAKRQGASWLTLNEWPDMEDGWFYHAPIGTLPPNPSGLHEVLGNVAEWCSDAAEDSPMQPAAQGREQFAFVPTFRANRGGSFICAVSQVRSSDRSTSSAESRDNVRGLRPIRAIQP